MKLFHETQSVANRSPIKQTVTMSLFQLQELASRQQEQIESTHRMILNKEQRLNYLASVQDSQQGPILDYDQNFIHFKERISSQEAKLRKLRLLKSQIQKQRFSNSNICSELETVKVSYKEKERELSVAMSKIEALSRQLDELRKGNISNSYNIKGYKNSIELDKLRQELLYKSKICKQNEDELIYKRNLLYKRQADMLKIDQKINELQTRLSRKRQLNQQLSSQNHILRDSSNDSPYSQKTFLRCSMGPSGYLKVPYHRNHLTNIATVEPLPRYKAAMMEYDYSSSFGVNKQDLKYQTLPYNTKFVTRNKNLNFGVSQKMENNYRNCNASDSNCESIQSGTSGNGISVIINPKADSKDNSLEERPSPSGSSGSSDRISSSLTTYSYNEKLALNSMSSHNHYHNSNFENNYLTDQSTKDSDMYSRQYVPNAAIILSNNDDNQMDVVKANSCSGMDKFYKTKPSVPVKPIANSNEQCDTVDNVRMDCSFLLNHGLPSINEKHDHKTLDKTNNSTELNCYSTDNNNDDNSKNHEIEQRSSVSEIVNKLNNWSVTNSFDWEKVKRRPVLVSNEMEKELGQDSNESNMEDAVHSFSENESTRNQDDKVDQDVTNNNTDDRRNTESMETEISQNEPNNNNVKNSYPLKRLKGSLKNKDKLVTKKKTLGRRVSFDPLALLLDASLEGELDLVKKTSVQVTNPSASNDEGITALHNATCAGHIDIVKYLVEIGCDVNVQDSDGWTPLHCAASCNNLVMIKFLVKSGACIFATTFSDHETAAEKCEEDEEGFDGCSQYLYGIQDKLGLLNNGVVYAVYDYESQNQDELSFKNGNCIQVLRKGDDQETEWWWSKIGDKEGYIPRNLLGLYPRIMPSH